MDDHPTGGNSAAFESSYEFVAVAQMQGGGGQLLPRRGNDLDRGV